MEVSKQLHQFILLCERLLTAIANQGLNEPYLDKSLDEEEKHLIRFYCSELVEKIDSSTDSQPPPDQIAFDFQEPPPDETVPDTEQRAA